MTTLSMFDVESRPEDDFYTILGCTQDSSTDQVNAEYRVRVLTCHPDKHPDDAEAAARFKALQRAKEVLTDEAKRRRYDIWRNSGLSVPYATWCSMHDSMVASMHWVVKTRTEPMIDCTPHDGNIQPDGIHPKTSNTSQIGPPWQRTEGSPSLKKFRNYQI